MHLLFDSFVMLMILINDAICNPIAYFRGNAIDSVATRGRKNVHGYCTSDRPLVLIIDSVAFVSCSEQI